MESETIKEDWRVLASFFPEGWREQARETGALVRQREIDSPDTLLRLLLIHLAEGVSLRTTVAYARETGLCDIKDTALLYRLRSSGEWLRWIAVKLRDNLNNPPDVNVGMKWPRIRLIDGSSILEKGSTGSDWRLHYSFDLRSLRCDDFLVTDKSVGETFMRFSIKQGDLLLGDRAYCSRKGVSHVLSNGGDVLVRFHSTHLPLNTYRMKPFELLENLRTLKEGDIGDWNVYFVDNEGRKTKVRLCSIRKSKEAIEKAIKAIKRRASRSGTKPREKTLELAEYFNIITNVNRYKLKGNEALSLYRARWQVELAFKRLKSLLELGHLPKKDPESCKAWLHGKLVVALLVESIFQEAESISPWGYPLGGGGRVLRRTD
jgi:hypothetical protein